MLVNDCQHCRYFSKYNYKDCPDNVKYYFCAQSTPLLMQFVQPEDYCDKFCGASWMVDSLEPVPDETVGYRIKVALERQNMRQKDLAKKMGVKDPFISKIVNDEQRLNCDQIIALCKILKVSADWLLGTGYKYMED